MVDLDEIHLFHVSSFLRFQTSWAQSPPWSLVSPGIQRLDSESCYQRLSRVKVEQGTQVGKPRYLNSPKPATSKGLRQMGSKALIVKYSGESRGGRVHQAGGPSPQTFDVLLPALPPGHLARPKNIHPLMNFLSIHSFEFRHCLPLRFCFCATL